MGDAQKRHQFLRSILNQQHAHTHIYMYSITSIIYTYIYYDIYNTYIYTTIHIYIIIHIYICKLYIYIYIYIYMQVIYIYIYTHASYIHIYPISRSLSLFIYIYTYIMQFWKFFAIATSDSWRETKTMFSKQFSSLAFYPHIISVLFVLTIRWCLTSPAMRVGLQDPGKIYGELTRLSCQATHVLNHVD